MLNIKSATINLTLGSKNRIALDQINDDSKRQTGMSENSEKQKLLKKQKEYMERLDQDMEQIVQK